MKSIKENIILYIHKFINDEDTSINMTNKIESILFDEYSNDPYMEETAEMLASYRPEGGDYLYNKDYIKKRLEKTLTKLLNQ